MNNQPNTSNLLSSSQFTWKAYVGTAFMTDVWGTGGAPKSFRVRSERTQIIRIFVFSHKTHEDTAQFVYHSELNGVRATIVFFNT